MIEKKVLNRVIGCLMDSGGSFGEAYIQKSRNNSLRLEDGKIENAASGYDFGCGLRIWHKKSTFYAYVDSIEEKELINAARILGSAVGSSAKGKIIGLKACRKKESRAKSTAFYNPLQKKDILLRVDKTCRDYDPHIIQVSSYLSDQEQEIQIANSDGAYSCCKGLKVIISINAIAKRGKEIKTGHKSFAKTAGYEAFGQKKPEEVAASAAETAVRMLDAKGAPTGEMPVVIGPAFGGVIFHEACGHGLEADAVLKDASVFKGRVGQKIASDLVTAVDDGSMEGHWGSYGFDDEGCPPSRTVLIEEGKLCGYMHDLKSSHKLNQKQTGNGRRQSYRYLPYPRMSNTYIANGKQEPEDIIKSVNRGIYAKEFAGGAVDPATGDFVFGISEGYIIENGKIGFPIKGATLIGNGPNVLKKIEAVGNDLDFAPGFCGKNGQSLSNEVGQPTIKVSRITIGGTEI
ncbi:MAG: TldD/PmbA family protein [Actinomycetota bacterium]